MPGRFFEVWENVKNRLREQVFNTVQTASDEGGFSPLGL